jgi:hypothetical protein
MIIHALIFSSSHQRAIPAWLILNYPALSNSKIKSDQPMLAIS